jgi:hypothetical protein
MTFRKVTKEMIEKHGLEDCWVTIRKSGLISMNGETIDTCFDGHTTVELFVDDDDKLLGFKQVNPGDGEYVYQLNKDSPSSDTRRINATALLESRNWIPKHALRYSIRRHSNEDLYYITIQEPKKVYHNNTYTSIEEVGDVELF